MKIEKLLDENNVSLYDTNVKTEVDIVERMNRTLHNLIERYITLTGDYSYKRQSSCCIQTRSKSSQINKQRIICKGGNSKMVQWYIYNCWS